MPAKQDQKPAIWSALGAPRTIHDAGTTLVVTASKPRERSTEGGDTEVDVWLEVENTGGKPFGLDLSTYMSLYTGGLADWDQGEDTDTTNHGAVDSGPQPVMLGGTVKPGASTSGWVSFLLDLGDDGHNYVLSWERRSDFEPQVIWSLHASH